MKTIYRFLVKPKEKRYDNKIKVGDKELITNTRIETFQSVSKRAIVEVVPKHFKTDIQPGDEIIIHHNVFRRWYNQYGKEKTSRSYFKDDLYFVQMNQVYLYKQNNTWNALDGFTFIKPIEENNDFYF